ncbi:MAG: hypothetical protein QOJ63_1999 [Solirubrobacteraceae bacterium]|nr:hypothetical protein [Solirubrobacteraceae bacterium]
MSARECPRIDDAAGYVLRALPDGEWESYGYHVAECQECAAKVDELGFVSHALLSAAPQLSAPPDIRNRVMSVVRAEAELLQSAGAGADRPAAGRPARRFGFHRLRPLTAGALAAVLLALGLGVGVLLRGGPGACSARAATVDRSAGAQATATLRVCDGAARLALAGMQRPPQGRIYELWLDDPGDRQGPKPAGLFSVRGGRASVDVGDLHGRKTVLVTDEPLPDGSEVPTRTPIVKAVT